MNKVKIINKDTVTADSGNKYKLDLYFDGDRSRPRIEIIMFMEIPSPKWYNRNHCEYKGIWSEDFTLEEDKLTNGLNNSFTSIEEAIKDTIEDGDRHMTRRKETEKKSVDIINEFLVDRKETVKVPLKYEGCCNVKEK